MSNTEEQIEAVRKRLREMAAELSKTWTMQLTFAGQVEAERKLTWLLNGRAPHQPPRPMMRLTQYARDRIYVAIRDRFGEAMLAGSTPSMLPVMTVAGNELRRLYIERWERSGGDANVARLSDSWLAEKRRRGLDLRIGRATGELARAIAKSRVIVKRSK